MRVSGPVPQGQEQRYLWSRARRRGSWCRSGDPAGPRLAGREAIGEDAHRLRPRYRDHPAASPRHALSWLAWCQTEGVHPVTDVTGLHVALYARQFAAGELSPASAARKLTAVSG